MTDEEEKNGCKHPEDNWTNYWCSDCGEYCNRCGCRGPKGISKGEDKECKRRAGIMMQG